METSAAERTRQAEVFSIISHDVRGAVGVILVAISELLDARVGPLTEEQRTLVRLVSRSSARLTRLAANVAFLERTSTGPIPIVPQPVDARDVARRALEGFEKSGEIGEGRRVGAVLRVPEGRVWAEGDAELLVQATTNVIANAIRVAHKEVVVTVTAASDGRGAVVTVDDDGPGFPPQLKAKLLAPSVDGSVPDPELHGLGLFVTRGIVHAHGGTLSAEPHSSAEAAHGTRVSIVLSPPQAAK